MAYLIASELSLLVLEKRRRDGELMAPPLHQPDRREDAEPLPVVRRLRDLDQAEPKLSTYEGLRLRHGA